MRKDEIIIKTVNKLSNMYGDSINQQDVKMALEGVLYDYNVSTKVTALVPMNNMQDRMKLYLISKKIEGLSKASIDLYSRYLKKFSEAFIVNVEDITTMDVRKFLATYMQKGVSTNTIATITDILRGFFNWLRNEEYITTNPMDRVSTIKKEESKREPLTPEELEILYGGCVTLREFALLNFFVATGCRLSEVSQLKKSDINFNELKVRVVGKGNRARTVYFNAKAKVHLQKYLSSRVDDSEYLFVTERKPINRMSNRAIQHAIDKIRNQSGLERNVYPHKLRHSFGTMAAAKGVDITTIQRLLGHSELSTTQIYVKTSSMAVEYEYRKHMNG